MKTWVSSGIPVILRRALEDWGVVVARDTAADELWRMCVQLRVDVDLQIERWKLVACGKPGLSDGQRVLMMKQAKATRRAWRVAQKQYGGCHDHQ